VNAGIDFGRDELLLVRGVARWQALVRG